MTGHQDHLGLGIVHMILLQTQFSMTDPFLQNMGPSYRIQTITIKDQALIDTQETIYMIDHPKNLSTTVQMNQIIQVIIMTYHHLNHPLILKFMATTVLEEILTLVIIMINHLDQPRDRRLMRTVNLVEVNRVIIMRNP